jgi:hypothetical protein
MKLYIFILSFLLFACIDQLERESNSVADLVTHIDTYGEAMDADLTESSMVVAANYQGFIVYDVNRNDLGNITSVDSIYNNSNMDDTMGDNRAQEVIVSQNHNIAFITDIYDRVWLYKLNNGSSQYVDNYIQDCYGGTWLNVEIDDQFNHINVFTLVKHNSSESDDEGTIGDFDEYSTSVVWKRLYDINDVDLFPESNAAPLCEFSYNFGVLPEKISFDNGLLAVSNGELGIKVLKQLNEDSCFEEAGQCSNIDYENENDCINEGENWIITYELLTEFNPTGDVDLDRTVCQQAYDENYNLGLNGIYEPSGGFYPYVFSSFDLPGEVKSVFVKDLVVFSGLSTSNGCYMSLLDNNGNVINNLSIANGYTINNISENNGIIALSAGHDGALLYQWNNGLDVEYLGQIQTPYSNNVKVDGDNIIVSTEDGVYIYILK